MEPSWLRPLGFCIPIVSVINEMTTGGFHLAGPSFSFSKKKNTQKLCPWYLYRPFPILEFIGQAVYCLNLPAGLPIQWVFHVSQIKKYCGTNKAAVPLSSAVDDQLRVLTGSDHALATQLAVVGWQVLIMW